MISASSASRAAPPRDAWNLSYACFFLLGTAFLLPWNSFISAADYYSAVYPGAHIDRLFTVCYLPINLAVLCALAAWPGLISAKLRVFWGLCGLVASLAIALVLTLRGDGYGRNGLKGTLLAVTLSGMADALAQGALFGMAAVLRAPRYTQALVAGTAASGVLASLGRIISKLAAAPNPAGLVASARAYFAAGVTICLLSVAVAELVVPYRPDVRAAVAARIQVLSVRFHDDPEELGSAGPATDHEGHVRPSAASPVAAGSVDPPPFEDAQRTGALPLTPAPPTGGGLARSSLSDLELSPTVASELPASELSDVAEAPLLPRGALARPPDSGSVTPWHAPGAEGSLQPTFPAPSRGPLPVREVLRCVALPLYAVALAHAVTLSIFPGVLTEDVSSASLGDWYGVLLVTLFNASDLAGKAATAMRSMRVDRPGLIAGASTARLLLVPAFYMAARTGSTPMVVLLTALLGMSHGWVAGSAMIATPALVPRREAEAAGNLMVLGLVAGLNVGAFLGFLWLI